MALDLAAMQAGVPTAFDRALQGFQAGTAIRQNRNDEQAQMEEAQALKAKQARTQQALIELSSNPSATAQDYARVMVNNPEIADNLKSSYELMEQGQQDATRTSAIEVFSALEAGQPDIAKRLLERQLEAAENSGDERRAAGAKAQLQILANNPDAAKTSAGLMLAASMGEDEFSKTLDTLRERSESAEMRPIELKQAAAQVGLTESQAKQALANAESLSANTQKTLLEVESLKTNGKPIDPKVKFGFEKDLRSDYNKLTGDFVKVQDAFRKLDSAEPTAAGDMSLIFSYMKMLDPGSTVREGEFANAQNATGLPGKVVNTYNYVLSGNRLNEDQRKEFNSQARALFKTAELREKEVRNQLMPAIKNYDLNPNNVFGEVQSAEDKPTTELTDEELDAAIAAAQSNQ